jgi:hypothetical protein
MTESWVTQATADFWAAVGNPEPFPRTLEAPVLWALPLAIVKLPRMRVSDVDRWLRKRAVSFSLDCPDRPLRGCLVAYGDKGCVVLDGADPADELRFTLAHEVGHFLIDYLEPRQRAVGRLGPPILEVFDGVRPPTVDERVAGLLTGSSVGVHMHLMTRGSNGDLGCGRIARAEYRADELALELLAPESEVLRRLPGRRRAISFGAAVDQAVRVLVEDFGLPSKIADRRARFLSRRLYSGPSFKEWMGL